MKNKFFAFLKKNVRVFIGIAIGIVVGLVYWYYWGCPDGYCPKEPPLKANPYACAVYGGLIGGLIFESLNRKDPEKEKKNKNETNEE